MTESPLTVRLKFEPAGRAVGEVGKFYQQAKLNRCVVCGRDDSYQRKNIVPREYRKYFPGKFKNFIWFFYTTFTLKYSLSYLNFVHNSFQNRKIGY